MTSSSKHNHDTTQAVNKTWLLAGEAIFTIEVPTIKSNDGDPWASHYTYLVEKVEANGQWPTAWFVKSLTGPNNTKDYTYVGKLDTFTGQVRMTKQSAFPVDCKRVRLLNKVLARIWCDDHNAFEQHGFHVHHEGMCARCGHKLTTPGSVKLGIGPDCAAIMGIAYPTHMDEAKAAKKAKKKLSKRAPKYVVGDYATNYGPGEATVSPITGLAYTGD